MKKIDIMIAKLIDECQKENIDVYCLYNEHGVFDGTYCYKDTANEKVVTLFEGIHAEISNKGYGSITRGSKTFIKVDENNECTE